MLPYIFKIFKRVGFILYFKQQKFSFLSLSKIKKKKKVIVFPINYETTIQSFIDVFDINATCTKQNKIFFTIYIKLSECK